MQSTQFFRKENLTEIYLQTPLQIKITPITQHCFSNKQSGEGQWHHNMGLSKTQKNSDISLGVTSFRMFRDSKMEIGPSPTSPKAAGLNGRTVVPVMYLAGVFIRWEA